MPFKRDDWNALIDDVNEVITHPPADTDCEPRPALEHVGPNTIWRKSHIREVQEAIKATCSEIQFDTIPDLWQQSILDEIRNKLEQAWCDCEPDDEPCTQAKIQAEHGAQFSIFQNGPPRINCNGDDGVDLFVRDFINGRQFGQPGIFLRVWRLFRFNHRNDGIIQQSSALASGVLSCQGILTYTGNQLMHTTSGVHCGACCPGAQDQFCQDVLVICNDLLNQPSTFYSEWKIIIDTQNAFCKLPNDDCP